jgi:hypothetical protein
MPDIDPLIWTTASISPSKGEEVWNFELVEYTTKDSEGKNLYSMTDPARVAYLGTDGASGAAAKDFNISASSQTFKKGETATIQFTSNAQNLGAVSYKWYRNNILITGAETGTYSLSITGTETNHITIKCECYETTEKITWKDEVTLLCLSDGAKGEDGAPGTPAMSIALSNPTMTFNKDGGTNTEETKVLIYYGTEPLTYSSTATSTTISDNHWIISSKPNKVTISTDSNPTIAVKYPWGATDTSYSTTLELTIGYKVDGKYNTQVLPINCTRINNGAAA